tara:strand:- start:270 stop:767 length:498 start_codon:yes stop_codon:yes gene_type:complete
MSKLPKKTLPELNSVEWFDYVVSDKYKDWYNGPYEYNETELNWIKNVIPSIISKDEKILDVGCGHGKWYDTFSKITKNYIGADTSKNMIDIAKRKNPNGKWIHIKEDYTPLEKYDTIMEIWSLYVYPGGREGFINKFSPFCNRILLFEGHGLGVQKGQNWEEIIC